MAVLVSLRGTLFVYQGEELGLPQAEVPFERLQDPEGKTFWPEHKGRDGARTPMPWRSGVAHAGFSSGEPWLPVDPAHDALAVDRQEADPASILNFTRALLAWRKRHRALIDGDIRFLDMPEPVLAFERAGAGKRLLCVFSLGYDPVHVRLSVEGAPTALEGPGLSGEIDGDHVRLPGYGAVFAVLE
jgi:alpha-glucosidase